MFHVAADTASSVMGRDSAGARVADFRRCGRRFSVVLGGVGGESFQIVWSAPHPLSMGGSIASNFVTPRDLLYSCFWSSN